MGNVVKLVILCYTFLVTLAKSDKVVALETLARWNHTSFLAEASEFVSAEDSTLFWEFVDKVPVNTSPERESHEVEYEKAIQTAAKILGESRVDLLKLSLSLRLFSPLVQTHYQIGAELNPDCSIFIQINRQLICDSSTDKVKAALSENTEEHLFANDHVFSSSVGVPAILYADFSHPNFLNFHNFMKKLDGDGMVRYVLRHFSSTQKKSTPVAVSGYGVELAIKNTEYKAVDDATTSALDEDEGAEVHGVNFTILRNQFPEQKDSLSQFRAHLLELDELSSLKQWEVSELGYQASQKIASVSPEEALATIVDLSQNFPTRARSLVQVRVGEVFQMEVKENQKYLAEVVNINEGENALFINGIPINSDTVDIFQLYETVHNEEKMSSVFYSMGFRREYLSLLFSHTFKSDKSIFAVDFRSANPLYINNLDKDPQYKSWGNSVKALLQPTYMGMLRPIARNFFTLIFVIDPSDPRSKALLGVGHSLYIHKVPIRIGFIFAVNPQKTVSGMNDLGVCLLNMYNFAKSDRNSAARALDLIIKALENGGDQPSVGTVQRFFKKKFPDVDIKDVFDVNSDYDEGRTAGSMFVKNSGIGSTPQVLLNGIALDSSSLSTDRIEEAILIQIMKQTSVLQRAVVNGKLKDEDNVMNWVMNQPEVLPRLNTRLLAAPSEILSLGEVNPVNAKDLSAFKRLNRAQKTQFILQSRNYATSTDAEKTYFLTIWVVGDFDTIKGRKLLWHGMNYLKKTKVSRISIINNGEPKSVAAGLINAIMDKLKGEKGVNLLLQTLLLPAFDLSNIISSAGHVKGLTAKELEIALKDVLNFLPYESEFTVKELGLKFGMTAVVGNGYMYGPLANEEVFEPEDFSLLEELAKRNGAKSAAEKIDEWEVEKTNGKSSDVVMRVVATLAKYGTQKDRRYVSVPEDTESVIHLLATDPKRPILDITFVVNPLLRSTQKLSSIVLTLSRVVNCDLHIILNPKGKLSELPIKRFYRFALNDELIFDEKGFVSPPLINFGGLPSKQLLTLSVDPPDSWMVQPLSADYDLDNLKMITVKESVDVKYELTHILLEGHCFDEVTGTPPRGLQFILGTIANPEKFDTIVMANLGYFQLKASPGAWILQLREGKSKDIYKIQSHSNTESGNDSQQLSILMDSFLGRIVRVKVTKKPGKENQNLLSESDQSDDSVAMFGGDDDEPSLWSSISNTLVGGEKYERINIFSLASGHLYERFLRIMMASVMKHTKHPVKFWLLNNYLSPQFRKTLPQLAHYFKFDYELVEYKWPHWLHQQSEKQRVMWGYKILFLDVLFPLNVKKIIFVDADQVVRTDMMELMDFDLGGAPYGYTPFCDSRKSMDGFRFWKSGYWASHLAGRRYHISALYVVDLVKFRQIAAGDRLRGQYQGLSADPNSLSNLDQDLPNNMIHQVRIKSLPQEWLYCETWCADEEKSKAKTIDLCNNPLTKEPKLESASRIIPEWNDYDMEVKNALSNELAPAGHKHGDEL